VLAGVQCIEIGVAINAKNDRLAIDHELLGAVLQRLGEEQGRVPIQAGGETVPRDRPTKTAPRGRKGPPTSH